jgi:hypothetical protein
LLLTATDDATIDIYGVNAKTDKDKTSKAGAGIYYNSDEYKIKLESTSDYIKGGAVLKFNPLSGKWYIKVGVNAINQKMYSPDGEGRVNQYSGMFGTGYMIRDDIYAEIGYSYTDLNGKIIGTDYEVKDEATKQGYIELAKRWQSPLGVIDTTANYGHTDYEFKDNEDSYGGVIDYYPTKELMVKYGYQYEENNIDNQYKLQYRGYFVTYNDQISADTYSVKFGVSIQADDWGDFSSYKMANPNPKHLSNLHKFEDIAFANNMSIQSTGGIEKTQEATDRDANDAPVLSGATATGNIAYGDKLTNIGLTITDDDLSKVTWTLSYIGGGANDTGTFSQTTGTGNTLSGITFTPTMVWNGGWRVKATIVDSASGSTQTVTLYSN